jgi:hypothetical protein
MTTDLDTRLRAASDSLRRSVEGLSADGLPRRHRLPLVAVALLVVLMVAAALVVLWDDDRRLDVATGSSEVPRLIAEDVPHGLAPTGAVELPLKDQIISSAASITVYGDPAADHPFAAVDLGVLVVDSETFDTDGEPVTVRGRQGAASDDSRFGVTITWREDAATQIMLASHRLDRGQLLAIAEQLVVDGHTVTLGSVPSGLSGPLEQIGGMADLSLGTALPVPESASGYMVGYQAENIDRTIIAATFAGGASDLAVIRWMGRADRPADVRGHSAWVGAYELGATTATIGGTVEGSTLRTLVWEESPGVVAVIQASDTTEAELLAIAESLRAASDEDWQSLIARVAADDESDEESATATTATALPSSRPPAVPDDAVVYLQGDYADGTWAVYIDAAGSLCGETASGDAGSGVCTDTQERAVTLRDNDGNAVAIFGTLPEGATELSIPGSTASPQTNVIEDGQTIYAAVIQYGSDPAEVTFYNAQSQVIATAPVGP